MTTRIYPILTVADLEAAPDDGNRYELIEGELLVSCAPHLLHQTALSNLLVAIKEYLRDQPIGKVLPGIGVIFSEHNAVIPDLVYISNERFSEIVSDGRLVAGPDLAIEILPRGVENERRDRQLKHQLYGTYGVREYWIVDLEKKAIEMFLLREGELEPASIFHAADVLTSPSLPGFSCPVEPVFEV
jgi:Uma2 family endonuclease